MRRPSSKVNTTSEKYHSVCLEIRRAEVASAPAVDAMSGKKSHMSFAYCPTILRPLWPHGGLSIVRRVHAVATT